jgi:hypothetical protein
MLNLIAVNELVTYSRLHSDVFVEFLDGFRMNSTFQAQDRDKLLNLASSLTSFFEHTGITNLVQSRIASTLL